MRRIPVLATVVVLAAVAGMVALGFWQLRRLHQKEALLAHYAAAQGNAQEIDWTGAGAGVGAGVGEGQLYRRARLTCSAATGHSSIAGRNAAGQAGVVQTVRCALPGGGSALVVLGWSLQPNAGTNWTGGEVHGVIAPGPRLVADPPLAGLQPSARPDPSDIPNNHFSYAIQWFLFAATALAIYGIALAKRSRG